MQYARKRDQSEADIVKALEAVGCIVQRGQEVDLYVSRPATNGFWLMECKTKGPNERRRQPIQAWLYEHCPNYRIVKSVRESLEAVGIT